MATIIKYNGGNPFLFDGEQYSPTISQDVVITQLDQRFNSVETYSINGEIHACQGFNKLLEYQKQIINGFNADFKTLEIEESGQTIFQRDFCKILSINFPQNRYSAILPFSITLESYPKDFFKSSYYIQNPADSWSFSENKNKTLEVSRTISAKGIRDNKSAIENAKNFVLAQKEINKLSPTFICKEYNLCLQSVSESINRFTGEYSLTQSYIADINKKSNYILRYSVDQSDAGNGIIEVTLSGDIKGCKNTSFSELRNYFVTLSPFSLAYETFTLDGAKYLNPNQITESITENEKDRVINFSYTFNNQQVNNVFVKLSVSINESTSDISATVSGEIRANKKYKVSWQEIKNTYKSFSAFPYAQAVFNNYVSLFNNKGSLYSSIISKSKTENEFVKRIDFSYTYSNNKTNEDGIFKNFNSSINIIPAINKFSENIFIDSQIGITNLGYYNRCRITISGSATSKKSISPSVVKNEIELKAANLFSKYGKLTNSFLESKSIENGFDNKNWSFNFSWSFDNNRIHNSDYKTINVSSYV